MAACLPAHSALSALSEARSSSRASRRRFKRSECRSKASPGSCFACRSVASVVEPPQELQRVLPPLVPSEDRETYVSLHRLRRQRNQVDGLTRISEELADFNDSEAQERQAHAFVSYLADVIRENSSDASCFERGMGDYTRSGNPLDSRLASEVMKHLCKQGQVISGLMFLKWLTSRGFLLSRNAYTRLLAGVAKTGPFHEAETVFAAMRGAGFEPSLHACTALMQARSQSGKWTEALAILVQLREAGLKPDTMIYNCAIGACGRAGQVDKAVELWKEMEAEGCAPNPGTMSLLLSTFISSNKHYLALDVYFTCKFTSLGVTREMYKGIICLLAKAGRWPFAVEVYREAKSAALALPPTTQGFFFSSSPIIFNSLITSLSRAGKWEAAYDIYGDMCNFGIAPDQFTWCALASALARAGEYDRVMSLNKEMTEKWGLKPNVEVCNSTLLACQQTAKWERAIQLLWQMENIGLDPDVISFSTAIRACEKAGHATAALQIFRHMQRASCLPNAFTYGAVIRTLGRAKDWNGAKQVFEDMLAAGQEPNVYVYHALLLAMLESKRNEEALSVLERMRRQKVSVNKQITALLKKHGLLSLLEVLPHSKDMF